MIIGAGMGLMILPTSEAATAGIDHRDAGLAATLTGLLLPKEAASGTVAGDTAV